MPCHTQPYSLPLSHKCKCKYACPLTLPLSLSSFSSSPLYLLPCPHNVVVTHAPISTWYCSHSFSYPLSCPYPILPLILGWGQLNDTTIYTIVHVVMLFLYPHILILILIIDSYYLLITIFFVHVHLDWSCLPTSFVDDVTTTIWPPCCCCCCCWTLLIYLFTSPASPPTQR